MQKQWTVAAKNSHQTSHKKHNTILPPNLKRLVVPNSQRDGQMTDRQPEEDQYTKSVLSMTKQQNLVDFLEKHLDFLKSFEEKVHKNCGSLENPVRDLPCKSILLKDNLAVLIRVIKHQMRLKDISIEQLFSITNKVVDIQEFHHVFKEPNDLAEIQIGGSTSYSFFELESEQKLLEIQDDDEFEAYLNEDSAHNQKDPTGRESHNPLTDTEKGKEDLTSQNTRRNMVSTSSRQPRDLMRPDFDEMDEYTMGYYKSKKKFKLMLRDSEDMRHEQHQYIVNSLKMLVLFLHADFTLSFTKTVPKQDKLATFLANLDYRVKITIFVLIQRLNEDEKLHAIAQEALDFQTLSQAMEKQKKHAMNQEHGGGIGSSAVEEMMKKKLKKDKASMEDSRKVFDQFGRPTTLLDTLLFNEFSTIELCKLKLDFLGLLHVKKDLMASNFNVYTHVELIRFEQQVQTSVLLDDHIADIEKTAKFLYDEGSLNHLAQDPVKMYLERSIKHLVLVNRMTGPALCIDSKVGELIKNFFTSKVVIQKGPEMQKEPRDFTVSQQKPPPPVLSNVQSQIIKDSESSVIPSRFQSERTLQMELIRQQQQHIEEAAVAAKKEASHESSGQKGNRESLVWSSLVKPAKPPVSASLELEVSNLLISSTILTRCISKMLFHNNLQEDIQQTLRAQLNCLIGLQPPQFLKAQSLARRIETNMFLKPEGFRNAGIDGDNIHQVDQTAQFVVPEGEQDQLPTEVEGFDRSGIKKITLADQAILGLRPYVNQNENFITQSDILLTEETQRSLFGGGDQDNKAPSSKLISNRMSSEVKSQQPVRFEQHKLRQSDHEQGAKTDKMPSTFGDIRASQTKLSTASQFIRLREAQSSGTIQPEIHTPNESSHSICTQDFVLLTDMLSLSEVVSIFSMGFPLGEQDSNKIRRQYTSLLPIEKIEYLITKQGKFDIDLLKEDATLSKLFDLSKSTSNQFSFEMSSLNKPMQSIDSNRLGASFFDQDLFTLILICGLFETKSISSRSVDTASNEQSNWTVDSMKSSPGKPDPNPLLKKQYFCLQFEEAIKEYGINNFAGKPDEFDYLATGSELALRGKNRSESIVTRLFSVCRNYLGGYSYRTPIESRAHNELQMTTKLPFEEGADHGQFVPHYNLVSLFAQLMVHQQLQKLLFERNVLEGHYSQKLFYLQANRVYYLFVKQLHRHYRSQKALQSTDYQAMGPSAVFDFSDVYGGLKMLVGGESEANHDSQTTFLNPVANLQKDSSDVMPFHGISSANMVADQDPAVLLSKDYIEYLAVKDYQMNQDLDQEEFMAHQFMSHDFQKVIDSRQRYLQKMVHQIQIDQLSILQHRSLVKPEQIIEIVREQIEAEKDKDPSTDPQETFKVRRRHEVKNHTNSESTFFNPGPQAASGGAQLNFQNLKQVTMNSEVSPGFGRENKLAQNLNTGSNQQASPVKQRDDGPPNPYGTLKMEEAKEEKKGLNTLQPNATKPLKNFPETPVHMIKKQVMVDHQNVNELAYSDVYEFEPKEASEDLSLKPPQQHDSSVLTNSGLPMTSSFKGQRPPMGSIKSEVKQGTFSKMAEAAQRKNNLKEFLEGLQQVELNLDILVEIFHLSFIFHLQNRNKVAVISKKMEEAESLLYTCDLQFLKQRQILVNVLKSVENGMEDREKVIKDQLRQIAILEMEKGKDEDEMLDQTLKTIEIVNIADIAVEKDNLQAAFDVLQGKKNELDRIEEELLKEKAKRDARRAQNRGQQNQGD